MSRFQEQKKRLTALCARKSWKKDMEREIDSPAKAIGAANAFLSLLNRVECRWQAAYGLGLCLPLMASGGMEPARVFMRRLMWSLNEESGNLGWGIPEAMGCILAASPALADEYARIFISYGYETGRDDNFLDHGPLRRGVYWGIGRLAQAGSGHALPALSHLVNALGDQDGQICAYAAWALQQLASCLPAQVRAAAGADAWQGVGKALRREMDIRKGRGQGSMPVEYFNGEAIVVESLEVLLAKALRQINLEILHSKFASGGQRD
jgi:hypothetical protein